MSRFFLSLSLIAGTVIALSTRYVNEDLFGAMAAGRDIWQGMLTAPDHWSFTEPGRIWVNQAWLSHLSLFLSYRELGALGPVLVKGGLFAACLGVVISRCRSLGASGAVSLVALVAGTLATAPFLGLRQENFGLFFFLALGALLARTSLSRRGRWLAIVPLMVVWSNAHGSFMLGLALLLMKALLETVRKGTARVLGSHDRESWSDVAQWWGISAVSVAATALCNPFGTENVLMPFRQLGTAAVTEHSADWLPLLSFQQIDEGLFAGGNIRPYLAFVSLVGLLLGIWLISARRHVRVGGSHPAPKRSETLTEVLIAAVTLVLAFRFGRLALFSALTLVPVAAALLQSLIDTFSSTDRQEETASSRTGTIAACGLLVAMVVVAYRVAVVAYLPGNPLRPARPVLRELMSFDSFSPALAAFMKENGLTERVLSGWGLSPYLMWKLPEIRLFMDTRDQSYYPEHVVRDYFRIMGIAACPESEVLALLQRYRVDTLALTTGPVDFDLGLRLMNSRQWICVYEDPYSLLLVRADSPRFRDVAKTGDLGSLRYPDSATRLLSAATLAQSVFGMVPQDLVRALKEEAIKSPWPNYYGLICWGLDDPRRCFKPETVAYLLSEADRLAQTDPFVPSGAEQVTQSAIRVYEILAENSLRCGDQGRARQFMMQRDRYQRDYDEMRRYYLGGFP